MKLMKQCQAHEIDLLPHFPKVLGYGKELDGRLYTILAKRSKLRRFSA